MKRTRRSLVKTVLLPTGLAAAIASCALDAERGAAPPPPPPEVAQSAGESTITTADVEPAPEPAEAEEQNEYDTRARPNRPQTKTEPKPDLKSGDKGQLAQDPGKPAKEAEGKRDHAANDLSKLVPMKTPAPPATTVPMGAATGNTRETLARKNNSGPVPSQEKAKDKGLDDGRDGDLSGNFESRQWLMNPMTKTEEDRLSTFAIDVDTAAYSIARRTLDSEQLPNASLVRVEEFLNYFKYDYEQPNEPGQLFAIQADGGQSPVDSSKVLFRVGIQAKPVTDKDRMPSNLVFLFDTSCSMTSGDKLELAKTSLKLAVDRLREQDKVAITTYAGGVQVVLPPTSGDQKAKIKRAIDSLQPGGGTAMASGLELAYRQAAAMLRDDSITRIIICSDGDANIGATTPEQMLKSIEGYMKEGVFISTIGFGDGNYKDATMEQIANKGNGNYYYIDSHRQAERVFGRDFSKMIQDVAQDVKIQVEFDPSIVEAYRLVGYENRDVADRDFRNDSVDAGEIGAGHQVTALYELALRDRGLEGKVATVRVRAKKPKGSVAKELAFDVPVEVVRRPFGNAAEDFRFATAVMGGAELLRKSPYASGWTFARVMSIVSDTHPERDPDRAEFMSLMKKAAYLSGEQAPVGMR